MTNKIKQVKTQVFGSKTFRVAMYLKSSIIYAFLMFVITWGLALWIFTTDHFFTSLLPKIILGMALIAADVMYFSLIISPIIKNSYKAFNDGPYLAAIALALRNDSELSRLKKCVDDFYADTPKPFSSNQLIEVDILYRTIAARKETIKAEIKAKMRILVDSDLAMGL